MTRANLVQRSLAAGEFSQRMDGQTAIAQYAEACRQLLNFISTGQGSAHRRSGTHFVAETKDSTKLAILLPFQFSTIQAYNCEFGNLYARFYVNEARLESPPGTPIEVVTPYLETQLYDLQTAQENDVMYVVHPSHQTYKLTRTSATSFTFTKVVFEGAKAPLRSPNISAITMTPAAVTGSGINVTATAPVFDSASDVGRVIRIKTGYGLITSVTSTTVAVVDIGTVFADLVASTDWALGMYSDNEGAYGVTFHEGRFGLFGAPNSPDRYALSDSDRFERFTQETSNAADAIVRRLTSHGVNTIAWGSSIGEFLFAGTSEGEFAIVPTDDSILTPTTTKDVPHTRVGCAHIQPLEVGNSPVFVQKGGRRVHTLVGSSVTQKRGLAAVDLSFLAEHILEPGGAKQVAFQSTPDPVGWMVRGDGTLVGWSMHNTSTFLPGHRHTFGGQFEQTTHGICESVSVIPNPEDTEQAAWVIVKRTIDGVQKRYVEYIEDQFRPALTRTSTEAERRKVLEQAWFLDSGLEVDVPVAITGLTQANPGVVTATAHGFSDGDEVRIEDVIGMVEVNEDSFIVANKAANTFELTDLEGVDVDTTAFGAYLSGGEVRLKVSTITGLTHLEGEVVQVLGDGSAQPDQTVASGAITLAVKSAKTRVGKQFLSDLETERFVATGSFGTSDGQLTRIQRAVVRVMNSLGLKIGMGSTPAFLEEVVFNDTDDLMGQVPPLFTGDVEVPVDGEWTTDPTLFVRQDLPYPLTIVSMMPRMEFGER